MRIPNITRTVTDLYRNGHTVQQIQDRLGITYKHCHNCLGRARRKGDLPPAKTEKSQQYERRTARIIFGEVSQIMRDLPVDMQRLVLDLTPAEGKISDTLLSLLTNGIRNPKSHKIVGRRLHLRIPESFDHARR